MKKILFMAFIAGATLLSCKKKNNPEPMPANTVSINGTTYSTVKIGTQTWTAVNYNGPSGTTDGVYYGGSTITTNPTYGKLYTLAQAQEAAKNLPTGWHLPTVTDMETLLTSVDAKGTYNGFVSADSTISSKLKSKSDWLDNINGNNSSGFNAYPAGRELSGNYTHLNDATLFWTSSADGQNKPYSLFIAGYSAYSTIIQNDLPAGTDVMMSIRFVKDN